MERRKLNSTEDDNNSDNRDRGGGSKVKSWFKKIGVAGFLFFLIKGIIWLLVFFGLFELASC
jgi:hypothetical protein